MQVTIALPRRGEGGVLKYDDAGLQNIISKICGWVIITPNNHPAMGSRASDALLVEGLKSLHERLTLLETGAFDAVRQTETTGRHVAPVEFSLDETRVTQSLTTWNEMPRQLQAVFETHTTRPDRAYSAMRSQFLHEEESAESKQRIIALIRTFDKIWNLVSIEGIDKTNDETDPSTVQFNVDSGMSDADSAIFKTMRFYQRVYFQTSESGFSMALECIILSTGACWLYVANSSVGNDILCEERDRFVDIVRALGTGIRQVDHEEANGISIMAGTKREIALSLIKPVRTRTSRSWPITDPFIFNVLLDKITFLLS